MTNTTQKWLIGCGIGCGTLIIIILAIILAGYFFIKDKVDYVKEIEATSDELVDRYGEVEDFTPDPTGFIAQTRMDTFLRIRKSTVTLRDDMESKIVRFSDDIEELQNEGESFWNVVHLIKEGIGIIPNLVEYYKERNVALLDENMSLGEYYYIYVIAYYSWLKKPIEDGPKFPLLEGKEFRNFNWRDFEGDYQDYDEFGDDVKKRRSRRILRNIHRWMTPMMERQLEDLADKGIGNNSWRKALETEIELLETDRRRIPWEDGLPNVLEDSLLPYRERLQSSYNAMVNPLELGLEN